MKKIKNIVLGGIQNKIFNVFLVTMILVSAAFMAVSRFQLGNLTDLVSDAGEKQQQAIESISAETMDAVISQSLQRSTAMEARIADDLFRNLESDVQLLADYAGKLYAHPDLVGRIGVSLPDKKNAGTAVAQLLYERGVDLEEPEIRDEIGLLGNMAEMMIAMFNNSDQINACFITSASGFTVMVDDRSNEKTDANGVFLHPVMRERPWYLGAKETGKLYFTDVEKDFFSDNIGIVCSVPIYKEDRLVAVVAADLFLDSMADAIESLGGESSFVYIVNQNGHVIFSPAKSGTFKVEMSGWAEDLRQSSDIELAQFIGNSLQGQTDVQIIEADGYTYYMTGAPLPTVGWAVISAVDKAAAQMPAGRMISEFNGITEAAQNEFAAGINRSKNTIGTLLLIIFVLGAVSVIVLGKKIVDPLGHMTKKVSATQDGQSDFEMEDIYRTKDEIEVLAEAFSDLSIRSKQYIKEIMDVTAEKERIGTELNVASQIQEGMLPSIFPPFPAKKEFDICASMHPAKEVGGDFYDFFLIDDDRLAMVVADVSGKGVPAALFMMYTKIMINNYALMYSQSPARVLEQVNHQICMNNKADMFVTTWFGVLKISKGTVRAANAGHEYPVIRRSNGEYELYKDKHGFVLGGMDGIRYKEYEFQLNAGDALFLYTDGVTEASNTKNELFGTERMLAALNTALQSDSKEILGKVKNAIDGFVGEAAQFDDITMLSLRYLGETMKKRTIKATVENLPQVLAFIDEELEKAECPMKTQMQIDVAVEEIFVNIADYAYTPDTGNAVIGIEILEDPKKAVISFADTGMPYNPLEKEDPDVTLSASERQIGGLGIYMVKNTMDSMEYEYRNGQNMLWLRKSLE